MTALTSDDEWDHFFNIWCEELRIPDPCAEDVGNQFIKDYDNGWRPGQRDVQKGTGLPTPYCNDRCAGEPCVHRSPGELVGCEFMFDPNGKVLG